MGFVNQFPYSDFHELNLDWLIKQTKDSMTKINELQEQMAQIVVMTEAQIRSMIDSAINSNNVQIYAALEQLRVTLTNEYKAYVTNQINLLTVYIDNQDSYYDTLAKDYADNAITVSEAYTDSQVLNYTMMINPVTGQYEDVRTVISDIVDYLLSDEALTAGEYDALDLTANAYDNYELTAYDYDFNGKNLLV